MPAGEALLVSLLLTVALAGTFVLLRRRWRMVATQLVVALLLPAAVIALRPALLAIALDGLVRPTGLRPPLHLVLGAMPLLLLPLISVLSRLPSGQARAAAGLGAGPAATLRLVWLPQLAPPLLLGLALAGLLDLTAVHLAR